MKSEKAVRSFDDAFIRSMSSSFPAIRAAGCRFEYFRERPAIQGTFTFGRGKAAMKGRYLIILISEQASLYTFSWSASKRRFIKWDKQSRASVESLTIFIPPTRDVALGKS